MIEGLTAGDLYAALAVWVVLAALVAWLAHARGGKPGEWFLMSLLLSPLLTFLLLMLRKPASR